MSLAIELRAGTSSRPKRSSFRSGSAASLVLILLIGCSLDERQLQTSGAVAGGAPGVMPGGGSGDLPESGAANAGAAGAIEATVDGCPDVDGNGVADCSEDLLVNGDFKADVTHWAAEGQATLDWDEQNAASDRASGSALLTATSPANSSSDGATQYNAKQCVSVSGNQLVTVYANTLVGSDQDSLGRAQIDVEFYDADGCGGIYGTSFSTPQPLDAMLGAWQTLKAGAITAQTVRSALVKLVISKPFRAASFAARFDNVLLKAQTP